MRCPRCGSNNVILATRCGSNDVILATARELSPPSEAMRAMELTPYYRCLRCGQLFCELADALAAASVVATEKLGRRGG